MRKRPFILFSFLAILALSLFVIDLAVGSVPVPVRDVVAALTGGECPPTTSKIVCDIRLVKAVVALTAGIALAISGLQMQTLFRNPLAGPYVLGVSSGASLAVALFLLGTPEIGFSMTGTFGSLGVAGAAWAGSAAVLALMAAVARRIKDIMVILILGMMIGSGVSAIVQILQYFSNDDSLKAFIIWTMGSLGSVTSAQLPVLMAAVAIGCILAVSTVKQMNLLLLGEEYAVTMGVDMRRTRTVIFVSTALLAGTVTAFCGPVGFVGLAVPHVARMAFANADHRVLLPGAALIGASTMLVCDIASKSLVLPVNAVTSLIGIPVVIWIVIRNKSITL